MNKEDKLFLVLFNFLKPYKFIISFIIFSRIFWGFFLCHCVLFLKRVIDILLISNNNSFSSIYSILLERYTILITALLLIRISHYLTDVFLIPKLRIDITKKLFNKIIDYDYSFFKINDGQILCEKINDFIDYFIELIKLFIYQVISKTIMMIVIVIFIFYFTIKYFSLLIFLFILSFVFYFFFKTKIISKLSKMFIDMSMQSRNLINDIVKNIFSVKLFVNISKENEHLDRKNDLVYSSEIEFNKEYCKIFVVYSTGCFLFGIVFTYYIFYFYFKKQISIAGLSLLWNLFQLTLDYLWTFILDFLNISRNYTRLKNAYELIFKYKKENNIVISNKKINIKNGKINFKNITFKYPNTDYLFQNFNLEIKASEKVAFVGYSGSGKTSLINLILKIFKVESGSIKIDDQNIDEYSNDSIYENISFIPQSPLLFKRSIRENIMYGKLNATEKEFQKSLRNASIDLFVNNLEKGANTIIGGEDGNALSGGQQQRVIIARAFLKNSPILILDEATSSLDSLTEMHIQESLKKLMINKTVIIVAHRLSTVMNMDRIIVFDRGKIIEEGSHEILLLKENGLYKKLWNTQTNGFFIDSENDIMKNER